MSTFSGSYKLHGSLRWVPVTGLVGDYIAEQSRQILIFEDGSELHLPLSCAVHFNPDRVPFLKRNRNSDE